MFFPEPTGTFLPDSFLQVKMSQGETSPFSDVDEKHALHYNKYTCFKATKIRQFLKGNKDHGH